jgi:haloacetate dehalogenase
MTDLFRGFEQRHLAGDGADIFLRLGGSGPPLLLVHGYPQTHAMWHRLAAPLAEHFTVVIPDLRGYGLSTGPEGDPDGYAYSKRAMGRDFFAVMAELGHQRFAVVGHDRGGRVGYRMALDRPDTITRLALLDIVPTYAMWHGMDHKLARAVYHWSFLAQPYPLPETLIGTNPVYFLDWTLASWTGTRDLSAFDSDALAAYRLHFAAPGDHPGHLQRLPLRRHLRSRRRRSRPRRRPAHRLPDAGAVGQGGDSRRHRGAARHLARVVRRRERNGHRVGPLSG